MGTVLAVVVVVVRCTYVSTGTRILPSRLLCHVCSWRLPASASCCCPWWLRSRLQQPRAWLSERTCSEGRAGPELCLSRAPHAARCLGEASREEARPGGANCGRGGTVATRPASAQEAATVASTAVKYEGAMGDARMEQAVEEDFHGHEDLDPGITHSRSELFQLLRGKRRGRMGRSTLTVSRMAMDAVTCFSTECLGCSHCAANAS